DIPQLRQVPGLDQRSRAVAPVRTGVEGISVARDARAALEVVEAVQVDLHHGRDLLDQSPACDAVIETGTKKNVGHIERVGAEANDLASDDMLPVFDAVAHTFRHGATDVHGQDTRPHQHPDARIVVIGPARVEDRELGVARALMTDAVRTATWPAARNVS